MKGLLIKDGRILFERTRKTLLIILAVGLLMGLTNDSSFFVVWFMLMGSILSMSTIAYDEYDNGYPFLMTLPVSRKAYAVEKYVFGILCGLCFWVFSVAFTCLAQKVKGTPLSDEERSILLSSILFPLLILDISIPISLKYGSERKRIILLTIWGSLFALLAFFSKVKPEVLSSGTGSLSLSAPAVILLLSAAVVLLTAVSVLLSIRIMENKEF